MSTTLDQTAPNTTLATDRLEQSLYNLVEVYRKHQAYIKLKYGVSALEMEIIQYILLDGKKKMKEIGEHFQVKLSTLTSIIDKIERDRLVKRVNSREDRRVVYLEVARKGQQLYEQYSQYMGVVSQRVQRQLDDTQYEALLTGLDHMATALLTPESSE